MGIPLGKMAFILKRCPVYVLINSTWGNTCISKCAYISDINECLQSQSPCLHGGTCKNSIGSFQCTCPQGWNGDLCESGNFFIHTYVQHPWTQLWYFTHVMQVYLCHCGVLCHKLIPCDLFWLPVTCNLLFWRMIFGETSWFFLLKFNGTHWRHH